ncbi:hypothetical protein KC19_6G163100 [Ceratodon purpureus]|uniref:Uncharacterized protein n=1 Tax=Ceratodon purpureus TaxID=3225 RepID=A0A8T0HIZ6_CERPU|nr:hypothetical protein KC19_6G163100 [Ceratodon purpureus]
MQAPPPGGRGGPLIGNFMVGRPSTSPSSQPNNAFKSVPGGAGHGGTLGASSSSGGSSGGINKSVVFTNKVGSGVDPRSPTAGMHPAAGRGGVPTSSTGGSLALRGGSGSGSVGPRLRAEGLMVPPASDAATLRRQVAALQIDLEAHIDGEQRLQSINHELRERLNQVKSLSFDSLFSS